MPTTARLTLKVTFEVGTDLDTANVLTQNRVSEAMPSLPQAVKNYGVSVKKSLAFPLLVLTLNSPKGSYDNNFLSNYASINVIDSLARIPGVGQVNLLGGSDYAMRIWLRPDRIAKLGITVPDIVNAINQQNQLIPAGQIGGAPAVPGTEYTYTVRTQGRLLNEEQFGEIIVRSNPDGSQVLLKDVARIELGTMLYNSIGRLNGEPARFSALYQIPGTNALEVAERSRRPWTSCRSASPTTWNTASHWTPPCRSAGDQRDRETLFEAIGAGDSGGVHLSAELARHPDSAAHCAGVADRRVHGLPAAGFLDQCAVAARTGAGDRYRGR